MGRFIYTQIHTLYMISVQDIVEINKKFEDGKFMNKSALEFAISSLKHTKDTITRIAYLIRAILVDHVFKEANKRTSLALVCLLLEEQKKAYDPYKAEKLVAELAKKNITDIKKIREMIKDVIR